MHYYCTWLIYIPALEFVAVPPLFVAAPANSIEAPFASALGYDLLFALSRNI